MIRGVAGRWRLSVSVSLFGWFFLMESALLPMLDAADQQAGNSVESFVLWKEGRCEVADATRLREAFKAYLAQPSIPEAAARDRITKLQEAARILGPAIPSSSDLGKAYAILQKLAAEPLDQGVCSELVRTIRKASDVLVRKRNPSATSNEAALRSQQEILSWNIAVGRKYSDLVNNPLVPSKGKGKNSPPTGDEQRLSEVMSQIRQMELGGEVTELQVRLELQDLALRFLTRGDYAESILAVRFYRGIFAERDGVLRLDPEAKLQIAAADSAPDLGVIETHATQTLANIKEQLSKTTSFLQSRALVTASTSLAAAFAQGARTLEVRSYTEASKGTILLQIRSESKLNEMMANKDYASALGMLSTLEGQSTDFSGQDCRSAIESGKSLSAIHLAAARKAGLEGKDEETLRELKQATDFWPKNPEIALLVCEFQGNARLQQATIQEFDFLYAAHKVQEIARAKDRFELALSSLPTRHSEFLGALEEGREINEGIQKAHQLKDFGSPVAAWELVEMLCHRFPEQENLRGLRAGMLSGVEPLADGLGKARDLEDSQPAAALARYLILQKLYPQSELASKGVGRLSVQLLEPPATVAP